MVSLLLFSSKQCIIKQLLDSAMGSIPIELRIFFFFFFFLGGGFFFHPFFFFFWGGGLLSTHILFIIGGGGLLFTHILFIIKIKVTRVKPLRAQERTSYDLGTQTT